MNKVLKSFILCLLLFPATMWGQSHLVPGTAVEEPLSKHHHDRPVNFGIKGGFTSSLFLVSTLNATSCNRKYPTTLTAATSLSRNLLKRMPLWKWHLLRHPFTA